MTLDRRTNGYDQDLCVLAKNRLIWIYAVFYAYTWAFKIIDNVVYYTPPQVSGGVLCFHVGPSVRPSVICTYVRPSVRTSFPFDSLRIYIRISFKFCISICTNNVSLGIVNGLISIIYHRVTALVNVQKMVFGLYFLYSLEYHNETSQK